MKSYDLSCSVALIDIYGICWLLYPSVLTKAWDIALDKCLQNKFNG